MTKLSHRVAICIFLGYGLEQNGYIFDDPVANRLRISSDVTFLEHVPKSDTEFIFHYEFEVAKAYLRQFEHPKMK